MLLIGVELGKGAEPKDRFAPFSASTCGIGNGMGKGAGSDADLRVLVSPLGGSSGMGAQSCFGGEHLNFETFGKGVEK